MSADKYPSIFLRQMATTVYIRDVTVSIARRMLVPVFSLDLFTSNL